MKKIKFTNIVLLIVLALLMVSCPFGAESNAFDVDTTLKLNSSFEYGANNIIQGTFRATNGIKNSDKVEVYLEKQGENGTFQKYKEDIGLNLNGVQFSFDTKNIKAYGKYRLICVLNGEERFFEFNIGTINNEVFSRSLKYASVDLTSIKINEKDYKIEGIEEIAGNSGIINDSVVFVPNSYKGLLIKYNTDTAVEQLGSLALTENSIQEGMNSENVNVNGALLLTFDELAIKNREFDIEVYPQSATNFVKKIKIKLGNKQDTENIQLDDTNIRELHPHSKSGVYFSVTADNVRTSYNKNDFEKIYNVMQISIQRYNRLNGEWLNIGTIKEELTDEEKETNEQYFYLYKSHSTNWESIEDEHFSYTTEKFKKFIYAKPIEMGYELYVPYEGEYRIAVEVISADKVKSSGIKYINGNSLSNKATFTDEVSSFVVEGYSTNSLNVNVNEIPFQYAHIGTDDRDEHINSILIDRAKYSINEEWSDIEWTIPKEEKDLHVYYTFDIPEFSENGGYLKYYEYFTKSGGIVLSYTFADGNTTMVSEDWDSENNPDKNYEMHTRYHHYTSDIHDRTIYIKNVGDTVVKVIAENVGGGYGNIYNVNEISDDKLWGREFKIYNNESLKTEMQGKVYTKERIEENDNIKFRFHFTGNPFAVKDNSNFDVMYFLVENDTLIDPTEYSIERNTYEEEGKTYYYIDYKFEINDRYDMNKCTLVAYIYPTKFRGNLNFVPYEECLIKLFVGNTISVRVDDEIQDKYDMRKYEISITENGITDAGLKCSYAFSNSPTLSGGENWVSIPRQGDAFSKVGYKTTESKEYLYIKTIATSGAEVVVKKEIELRPLVGIITYPIWDRNNGMATNHSVEYCNIREGYDYDFVIKNSYWHNWTGLLYHDNDTNICAWVRKGIKACIEMDYEELSHTVRGYSKTDVYKSEKDLTQIRYTIASKVYASTDGYPHRVFPIRVKALGYMGVIELNKGFLCHPYKAGSRGDDHNQYGQLPIQY